MLGTTLNFSRNFMAGMGGQGQGLNRQTLEIIISVYLLKNQDIISSHQILIKHKKVPLQQKQHTSPPRLSYFLTVVTCREYGSVPLILTSSLGVSINDDRVTPLDLIVSLNNCNFRDILKARSH